MTTNKHTAPPWKSYEVQHWTVADGWRNVWHVDDEPQTFSTEAAAKRGLREFFEDLPAGMAEQYAREDFRIVRIEQEVIA